MKYYSSIPVPIRQFIRIYITVTCIYTLFRLILFIGESGRLPEGTPDGDILRAFLMGVRFDLVVSGYILVIPYILLSLVWVFTQRVTFIHHVVYWFILVMFSISFLVCSIDIPFFHQFFSRLSVTALTWMDTPGFVFGMIFQEPRYWLYALPFIISVFLFYLVLRRIFFYPTAYRPLPVPVQILLFIVGFGLIFIGGRGRIEALAPIKVGTAYFSNNAFLNQLGLNPNFTFSRSFLDSRKEQNREIRLMPDSLALAKVQSWLNIRTPDPEFPVRRDVTFGDSSERRFNVVVIMMESMTAANLKRHGSHAGLTPFLDSLTDQGLYFSNAYTAGTHTYNGVFSTLFAMPGIFRQHPMKESAMLQYHGIFSTLREKGYSTIYFTNHDGQFDNVEGFLYANDCERVISKKDYPSDRVKTILGVPDDFMFEFSIPVLNDLAGRNKPFAAAFLTVSNHSPYYIPDTFSPKSKVAKKQVIEFSDFALSRFIRAASEQPWFDSTLFVLVADHGAVTNFTYDMPLEYNHSPLLFYAPGLIPFPRVMEQMAGQIDIFPTVMGLLRIPYTNNTLGMDLLSQERPYIYITGDEHYGVVDPEWFLVVRKDGSRSLYRYRHHDPVDYTETLPEKVREMQEFADAHFQTFQYLTKHNKQ